MSRTPNASHKALVGMFSPPASAQSTLILHEKSGGEKAEALSYVEVSDVEVSGGSVRDYYASVVS
jgi:hypothetical protein